MPLPKQPIREENLNAITRRWLLVNEEKHSQFEFGMDGETASVLRDVDLEEARAASLTTIPLFVLTVDESSLKNLLVVNQTTPSAVHRCPDLLLQIKEENEELLLNRWAAAREDDIQAKLRYCLSSSTISWLRNTTVSEIRKIAGIGHSIARMHVRPSYLYQAAKGAHLSDVQRDTLALASITTSRPI